MLKNKQDFIPLIKILKNKCLAGSKWEADQKQILTLYRTLIMAKLIKNYKT